MISKQEQNEKLKMITRSQSDCFHDTNLPDNSEYAKANLPDNSEYAS